MQVLFTPRCEFDQLPTQRQAADVDNRVRAVAQRVSPNLLDSAVTAVVGDWEAKTARAIFEGRTYHEPLWTRRAEQRDLGFSTALDARYSS